MKNYLFATAFAAAALLSTSALAQATGYVGAGYSRSEIDTPLGDFEGDGFALAAAVFAPVNESFGLQVDGTVSDSDDVDPTVSGTLHAVATAGAGRFGAFVSGTDLEDDTLWAVGGEGQMAVSEQITLAGVLAYAKIEDADVDVVGVGGEGRFFVSDNFRLDGTLGYLDVQDVDVSAWSFGVGAEYQFAAAPVSVFGGLNRVDLDDVDVTIDTLSIGVRYNFGGTLTSRDRQGASLPGLSGLAGVASIL
jgi:hypothetical protein